MEDLKKVSVSHREEEKPVKVHVDYGPCHLGLP